MRKLDDIAYAHNARIVRIRSLSVTYVSVMFNGQVDIGFSRKERTLIGSVLPFFAGRKIRTGLYARGKDIDRWIDLFAGDDELCAALRVLLEGYAYSIEWASSRLSARVSVYDSSIDGDATGGERFFANLDVVAARLSALGERKSLLGRSEGGMAWGPAALRKFALVATFLVPFALLMAVHHLIAR
ncbi:hypothetical protein [Paraburkholderia ginsengiterrae]|uniref:hypothetical protein n=1 Tax=Paraburkholderia ginsengiterrae TaxID=1462993 RepID=UPI0010422811|nr:hypothetical protein [Paraburkholderia ginsengiterrae]